MTDANQQFEAVSGVECVKEKSHSVHYTTMLHVDVSVDVAL